MYTLSRISLAVAAALCASGVLAVPQISATPEQTPSANVGAAAPAVSRGFKAIEAGDLTAAESAFREAIKLDPKAPGGYIGMAEVAAQRQQVMKVEPWLKQALEVDPDGVGTLRVWGRWLYQQKRYPEAAAAFRKAVAVEPDSIEARLNLGEVQFRGLKDPKAAEATFRAALQRSPDHVGARLALAGVLAAQGHSDEAIAAFEQAAKLAPRDPEPLLAMARYQASRGQIDAALSTLDRLIAAIPSAGQAYLDRGDLLVLKNDVPRAMESYRSMAKAVPAGSAAAHFRLAALHEARQEWDQAESEYRAAITAEPNFYAAYNNLAFLLANRGQKLDEALKLANRVVELAPNNATGLDTLGWVQRARGDLGAATKSIERAIALQPRNPTLHYHLGIVLSEKGRKGQAEAAFRKALEIDPKFKYAEDARKRLGQATAVR